MCSINLRISMGVAASRIRIAHNEIDFLRTCGLADTTAMLEAKQELRVAEAEAAAVRRELSKSFDVQDADERLAAINVAHEVGFALAG